MGSSSRMETNSVFCNSAGADAQTKFPFLGKHTLHTTNCNTPCNTGLEQIQIGYFYELNHQNLLKRSPIHLKLVGVVMVVNEKTDCNVEVKFPCSSSSLRTEFSQRTKLESFWLVQQPKDELSENSIISSSTSSTIEEMIPVAGGWCHKRRMLDILKETKTVFGKPILGFEASKFSALFSGLLSVDTNTLSFLLLPQQQVWRKGETHIVQWQLQQPIGIGLSLGLIKEVAGRKSSSSIRFPQSTQSTGSSSDQFRFGAIDFEALLKENEPQPPPPPPPIPPPPIPTDFFCPIQMPPGLYLVYVLQCGGAVKHFANQQLWAGQDRQPCVHGLWINGPGNQNLKKCQDIYDESLVSEDKTLFAWPNFKAPFRDAKAYRYHHHIFWGREWLHGIVGAMPQRRYFDFILDTYGIVGPLVRQCMEANTEEILGVHYFDAVGFQNQMEGIHGLFPIIKVKTITSTNDVHRVTAEIQVLWEIHLFMEIGDPRKMMDPSLLKEVSNFTTNLDIIIL